MAKPSSVCPIPYVVKRQTEATLIKRHLFRERLLRADNLYNRDLVAHYGCVNAIEFSEDGNLLVSGGDDRRVLLWSITEAMHADCSPVSMQTNHISNIFCLAFDSLKTRILSGGNDDQVIIHDLNTGGSVLKLLHKKPVYGLSVNPQNDHIVATAGDDGRILMYDIREPSSTAKQKTGFHSVMFNPYNSRLLATANSEEGISLWDYRKPKEELLHYDSNAGRVSGISVCFNSTGSRLLALRRRLPPVLYATQSQNAICQFYHPHYYNSCTMKTCCFAGDGDEYVLSGSDDFNLYMWRIPEDAACEWGPSHLVLREHRSIVNQVRYNKHTNLIASSGVEKMVKLWSTLPIGRWSGSLFCENCPAQRQVYSHEDYVYLVGHSGQRISHDYSDQSTQEDARMMAFFDSLIQREIEGWDSPSETSTVSSDSDIETQGPVRLPRRLAAAWKKTDDEGGKRHKPNRIAQLIAQKRNRLAKMAHCKSFSSIRRSNVKQARRKPKGSKTVKFSKRNGVSKKVANHRYHTRSSSPVNKSPPPPPPPPSEEKEGDRVKKSERWTRSKKHRAKSMENNSSSSLDAPSTSTGITAGSSSSVFRVIEQDSDEDAVASNGCNVSRSPRDTEDDENFVNILPTPLNGSHDMCLNSLNRGNGNVVTLRNDEYVREERRSSSPSTLRENRFCQVVDDDCTENGAYYTDDAYESYVHRRDPFVVDSDSSECDFEYTPVKKKKRLKKVSTPDSGFATGPCSSGSGKRGQKKTHLPSSNSKSMVNGSSCNGNSSDDQHYPYEKFRKRAKKARLNLRRQIGADSDS